MSDKTIDTPVGIIVAKDSGGSPEQAMFYHPMTGQYMCLHRDDDYLFPNGYDEEVAVKEFTHIIESWNDPASEWMPWPKPVCGSSLAGGMVSAIDIDKRTLTIQYEKPLELEPNPEPEPTLRSV